MVTLDHGGWRRDAVDWRPAPAALTDLVVGGWIDQRYRDGGVGRAWRIVADDAAHLIYAREQDADGERHRLHVIGARRRFVDVNCSRRILTVGLRLRPGALPVLFGVPASELTDRSVPAGCLVRWPMNHVMEMLHDAPPRDVLAHLSTLVVELASRAPSIDPRVRLLREHELTGSGAVRSVAARFGVTERGLRAWSATHVGFGLRRCLRIRRLHRALHQRANEPRTTWSTVAASAGFADQPHLVRECRSLLGESPTEFMARAS